MARTTLAVMALCLLGPMAALGQTGTSLDPIIENATKVGPLSCPNGSLCPSEAIQSAREQAFMAQMSALPLRPSADGIGYLVIPYDRDPLLVTPPVVGPDGTFALLVLLTNFPSLSASHALLEAFDPAGALVYDEPARLYKDVANVTSALVYFELVPGQGATHLEVTVGNHHVEVSVDASKNVDRVCGRDVSLLGEPCAEPCLDPDCCEEGRRCVPDPNNLCDSTPCDPPNYDPCDPSSGEEPGICQCLNADCPTLGVFCYINGCGDRPSSTVQAATPGCDLPLAVSPRAGAYDEEGQYDEQGQLITQRDINYMAALWTRQFSYSSSCETYSGGGGLMAVATGWRGPSRPLVGSIYGLDAQFVYHGDKCYGEYDADGSWTTSNWGSCRNTGSHTLWVKPYAQAMIPPTDGTVVFEFFEQAGPTFFNGVDTDETDCVSWYSRAADAVGFFGILTGLTAKIPTWATVAMGAGTVIVEQFLDRNACRFENYEELPGPTFNGKLVGNGIEISKKYYGGLSMLPQREVQSTILLKANQCEDY